MSKTTPSFPRFRRLLLRLALGRHDYNGARSSLGRDPRLVRAHTVDLVVRKDAVENRVEADWLKTVARIVL